MILRSRIDEMLTEIDVIKSVADYLEERGYAGGSCCDDYPG